MRVIRRPSSTAQMPYIWEPSFARHRVSRPTIQSTTSGALPTLPISSARGYTPRSTPSSMTTNSGRWAADNRLVPCRSRCDNRAGHGAYYVLTYHPSRSVQAHSATTALPKGVFLQDIGMLCRGRTTSCRHTVPGKPPDWKNLDSRPYPD